MYAMWASLQEGAGIICFSILLLYNKHQESAAFRIPTVPKRFHAS